ncbi:biotin-dependent carboxyltransferase [Aestuariicella hydrocarbonica]|uniref:Biotin-dependent carboxyltransferase n=1 Tax=Pseudomaricurvus hydrocarbonicus TaxID=1470433 RepID=A0A9E5MNU6_9GAMM|nr:biotin-dependent carboxyltransferase family protein [Aestuariicella hydrocarbonica]NHO67721.1 biotin-dependent carboxyltransferase [Aestuariicella hydrocarbonica]
MSITILNPGILSSLQDAGRFGQHQIGLTNGGPMDPLAFHWANRLCENNAGATAIEISVGGLKVQAQCATRIAVTGAEMPVSINGSEAERWRTHHLQPGDTLELGYSQNGCRAYLAISGGFQVEPSFGSSATVVREGIGGLNGQALTAGDTVKCAEDTRSNCWSVPEEERPQYRKEVTLRVIPGYQEHTFDPVQQRLFFHNSFTVSDRCDRMGYRLTGPHVKSNIEGILSEGICLGAIQVPADGQPIILMNDRQTIGGYPKIGSVLSVDLAKLAQLMPGDNVSFHPITIHCAHNALHLAHSRFQRAQLLELEN